MFLELQALWFSSHFCTVIVVWYADDVLMLKWGWTFGMPNVLAGVLLIVTFTKCPKQEWLKLWLYTMFFMFIKRNASASSKSNDDYTSTPDRFSNTLQISLGICVSNYMLSVFVMVLCNKPMLLSLFMNHLYMQHTLQLYHKGFTENKGGKRIGSADNSNKHRWK